MQVHQKKKKMGSRGSTFGNCGRNALFIEFISFLIVLMFYENNVRVRNEEYVDVFGNSG